MDRRVFFVTMLAVAGARILRARFLFFLVRFLLLPDPTELTDVLLLVLLRSDEAVDSVGGLVVVSEESGTLLTCSPSLRAIRCRNGILTLWIRGGDSEG